MRYFLIIILSLSIIGCMNGQSGGANNSTNSTSNKCQNILEIWKSIEKYPYVWGGNKVEEGGFDCSGAIYYVQKKIGKPVPRTTSKKYNILAEGKGKDWREGNCNDWIWWTFEPDRPFGHIGMHINSTRVWQSGSSTGPNSETLFDGSFWDKKFEESKNPY